ncbi:MAG: DHH family phosphoesterase [Candidatus Pacearchaeota archaeon]|nr:DHH family phosphoesterase [Candidatus Pacearchaeota archaeon]
MQKAIEKAVKSFLENTEKRDVKVISHHDTDGITSAAILAKTLKRLDKKFSIKIVKQLDKEQVDCLKKSCKKEVVIFLDLGSSLLDEISGFQNPVFVIDHHELSSQATDNVTVINPHLFGEEEISGAGLTYLFAKALIPESKDLANLAVLGMVGDMLDREVSKLNNKIIEDAEVVIKKGLMLYPATRPIHKALEFSSSIYIPGVTGNPKGVMSMLREVDIKKQGNEYKSLLNLDEEETSRLITAILLRTHQTPDRLIGNLYLVKFFNKLEDARELSAMINACSRLGYSDTALAFCLDNKKAKTRAETIYADYKQHLVKALNYADANKVEGKGYVILNARDEIKDTMIGTVASILSMSKNYPDGTVIIAMSYDQERIKVSARVAGKNGRNVREVLMNVTSDFGAECGGHAMAAGCLISKDQETKFLENLTKSFETEVIKI